jgi:hypothetical protein
MDRSVRLHNMPVMHVARNVTPDASLACLDNMRLFRHQLPATKLASPEELIRLA